MLTPSISALQRVSKLKSERDDLIRKAEKAAYDYACECDIGKEREKAFEIYENIRTAQRVYCLIRNIDYTNKGEVYECRRNIERARKSLW